MSADPGHAAPIQTAATQSTPSILGDYNTQVVLVGVVMLGLAAGLVGTFLLLRKQALVAESLGHSTAAGVGMAFMVAAAFGLDPRNDLWLLLGGSCSGMLCMISVGWLCRQRGVAKDTALAISLCTFFGLGAVLLSIAQRLTISSAAGLNGILYGSVATLLAEDALRIGVVSALCIAVVPLFFKELRMATFDPTHAHVQGYRTPWLDAVVLLLATVVAVVGLRAVGLILVVALLITPAATARMWTKRLPRMAILSAALGGTSALTGALLSAQFDRLPAGPVIVLCALAFLLISLLVAPERRRVAARGRA